MEVITDVELCRCDVSIELAFLPVATILTPVKKKSLQGTATVIGHLPADLDLVLVGLNNLHHRSSWWHLIKKKNNTKIIINCNTPNRSTCSTIQTIDWFVFFFLDMKFSCGPTNGKRVGSNRNKPTTAEEIEALLANQ